MAIDHIKINEYYFHSIIHGFDETLQTFNGIFDLGVISSPQARGLKKRPGCHRIDEICLTKKRKIGNAKLYISSFDLYLPELTTLILDREISKKCRIYQPKIVTTSDIFKIDYKGSATNIYDEYRTRDSIPVEYIRGISIPYQAIIDDPFLFLKGLYENVLIAYYNGNIDYREVQYLRSEKKDDRLGRKELLDEYIDNIETIIHNAGLDIPIYEYNNRQFKLR